MKGRSDKRGQRALVDAARKQAAVALGREPETVEPAEARYVPAERPQQPHAAPSEAVTVLSLGEAAAQLDISRRELEAMIAAGRIEAMPTGFTRMVPTSEVVRLLRVKSPRDK